MASGRAGPYSEVCRTMASTSQTYAYAAAWLRTIMASMALLLGPALSLQLGRLRWALAAYIVAALIEQALIKRQIGGELRAAVGGVLDVAILTAVTHTYGGTGSPMLALYMLIPLLNALVATPRVAWALAIAGIVAYGALLLAQYSGVLRVPSPAPFWSSGLPPRNIGEVLAPLMVMAPMVLIATSVTVRLARAVADREAALVAANEKLAAVSRRDPLTQLFNRRHLLERLDAELARVRRGHALALLMIDLDGFKAINDGLGHLAGDEALRTVSAALSAEIRETDLVGRYGGDEFVVLLTDADAAELGAVAERLRSAIAGAGVIDASHRVTASLGVAVATEADDAASLLRRADANAYQAKADGRDRVVGP